jgi:hypothetical protein
MVPSSAIIVTVYGECLTCSGFSLGETIRLRNFELIADYFSSLSLSCRGGGPRSWAQLVAGHLPHGGLRLRTIPRSSSRCQAGKEASASLLLEGMGASLAPVTTTPWMKDILDITIAQQAENSL